MCGLWIYIDFHIDNAPVNFVNFEENKIRIIYIIQVNFFVIGDNTETTLVIQSDVQM